MSTLSNLELRKPVDYDGKVKAPQTYREGMKYRWEIFLEHLRKNLPFVPAGGSKEDIIKAPSQIQAIVTRGKKIIWKQVYDKEAFISTVEREIKAIEEGEGSWSNLNCFNTFLKSFEKTEEFGSSGGSAGAGSKMTALVEASVASFCGKLVGVEASINSKKVGGQTVADLLEGIEQDRKGLRTLWCVDETANAVVQAISEKCSESLTKYHYQDAFVQSIGEAYKRLSKSHKIFKNFKLDKWNPADIWVTDSGYSPDFSSCSSLAELHQLLWNPEHCVGISLKKGGTHISWRRDDLGRNRNYLVDEHSLECSAPKLGTPTWFFYYKLEGSTKTSMMSFRPDKTSLKVEIKTKGKNARNGSTSQGGIQFCLDKAGLNLPLPFDLSKVMKILEAIQIANDFRQPEESRAKAEQECNKYGVDFLKVSSEELSGNLQKDAVYLLEKALYDMRKNEEFFRFVGYIHKLCGSDWDEHCYFLKVS